LPVPVLAAPAVYLQYPHLTPPPPSKPPIEALISWFWSRSAAAPAPRSPSASSSGAHGGRDRGHLVTPGLRTPTPVTPGLRRSRRPWTWAGPTYSTPAWAPCPDRPAPAWRLVQIAPPPRGASSRSPRSAARNHPCVWLLTPRASSRFLVARDLDRPSRPFPSRAIAELRFQFRFSSVS
jgi:hypothetical protein